MASHSLRNGNSRGTRPKLASDLSQAKATQKLAHKVIMSLEQDLDAATDPKSRMNVAVAIRSAIQAWDLARDAARIARNKPLPGSLRPESAPKKKKAHVQTFSEIPSSSPSGPLTPAAKQSLTATQRQSEDREQSKGAFGSD